MVGVTYKVIMQSHGMNMKQGKQKTSILIEVLWAEEQPLSYKKKKSGNPNSALAWTGRSDGKCHINH